MSGSQFFSRVLGKSVEGRDVIIHSNFDLFAGPPPPNLMLLIGGQHGDEPATVRLLESFRDAALASGLDGQPTAIIAPANPDGLAAGTRYNARGTDLNRNCGFNWHRESAEPPGPAPWSEPESRLLHDFILGWHPAMITLELPSDPAATCRPDELAADHISFVRERWARDADGYLRAVEPGVHAMLLA